MIDLKKNVGRKVRLLRESADITQEELSEISGVTQNFISQLESGKKTASIETLNKIAKSLEVPIASLFCLRDNNYAKPPDEHCEKKIKKLLINLTCREKQIVLDMLTKLNGKKKKTR